MFCGDKRREKRERSGSNRLLVWRAMHSVYVYIPGNATPRDFISAELFSFQVRGSWYPNFSSTRSLPSLFLFLSSDGRCEKQGVDESETVNAAFCFYRGESFLMSPIRNYWKVLSCFFFLFWYK